MKNPTYYLAVFGKPEPPDRDTVDSGRFFLGRRGADTPGERGDVMLLCCNAVDAEQGMCATGIGIILTKTKEFIFYRHLPFSSPISKDVLEGAFSTEDRNRFSDIRPNNYWIFDISGESFRSATRGVPIHWP
jgi:hypothetical protein